MKKIIIGIIVAAVILILFLIVLPVGWYFFQLNWPPSRGQDDLSNQAVNKLLYYHNNRYGYSVEFIDDWWVGYAGDSKEEAVNVWFVSDSRDLEVADGGPPLGAKIEVFVQNLAELKEVDSSFPEINSIADWLNWQQTYQTGLENEASGGPKDERLLIAGQAAIQLIYEQPLDSSAGKSRKAMFLDPAGANIFTLQYSGREPAYSANLKYFSQVLESFSF